MSIPSATAWSILVLRLPLASSYPFTLRVFSSTDLSIADAERHACTDAQSSASSNSALMSPAPRPVSSACRWWAGKSAPDPQAIADCDVGSELQQAHPGRNLHTPQQPICDPGTLLLSEFVLTFQGYMSILLVCRAISKLKGGDCAAAVGAVGAHVVTIKLGIYRFDPDNPADSTSCVARCPAGRCQKRISRHMLSCRSARLRSQPSPRFVSLQRGFILPDQPVHSVVTDAPYGLSFMQKGMRWLESGSICN